MNKKVLYILIAILLGTNIAVVSYLIGSKRSTAFERNFGFMGSAMHSEEEWEDMREHMEERWEEEDFGSQRHKPANYDKPVAETHNSTYDFGQVSKNSGVVSTTFEVENHGKVPLEIGDISTSCGCTTAEIADKTLGFNEETELTVYFDPNFHEEPEGVFTRSVFVETNDPDTPELQFDVYIEVVE